MAPGSSPLTREQRRFFEDNGYLLIEQMFHEEEVRAARRELARLLLQPEDSHPRMRFFREPPVPGRPPDPSNPHRIWLIADTPLAGDWWFRHITDPRILDVMVDCLGANIDFHKGFARIKSMGYQSFQAWHQDFPYDRHTRPELTTCIFYLEDTWEGAAATYVVPGSHKQGEWPHHPETMIDEALVGSRGIPVCARAGDVLLLHVLTVHRASNNTVAETRSCILSEYKSQEAIDLWGNTSAFADLPLRRAGVPLHVTSGV